MGDVGSGNVGVAGYPLDGGRVVVPEPVVKARLAEAGIAVPAPTGERLVLKAFGPGIVHKSDVGAVRLGLTADEVDGAEVEMASALATHGLTAEGFLVEAMAPAGIEVLVGVVRTPFGLAALAGLGGTLAELLDDVALGLVPVDADVLLRSFRASAALDGPRGSDPVDRAALAAVLDGLVEVAQSFGDRFLELECNPVLARPDGALAADARLILAAEEPGPVAPAEPLDLDALLAPRTIAVVGASTNRPGFGNRALAAYRAFGWTDGLWAVHPSAEEVDGVPAVPSVADVPGGADYVLVCVPAAGCPGVVEAMAGTAKVAHVISGGFAESGDAALQAELLGAARRSGVRVVGPNCIGVYAPAGRQTFQLNVPSDAGGIAVVSQSGGLAGDIVKAGTDRGLRFSCVVSAGNAIDVTPGELVERLAERSSTEVLGLYLEGTADGERILTALRRLRGRVPVAALVGGLSQQGSRAVASHTGSLAGDRRLWDAVSRDTGVTVVDDLDRFLGVLGHLDRYRDHPAGGDLGTLVVGVGGGASVLATDACDAAGLDVRRLPDGLVADLRALGYGAGTSVVNPIEIGVGPAATEDVFHRVLDPVLAAEPFADALLHVNVQAYYSYGTGGAAPLLAHLATLAGERWPATRLTVVLRNLDVAPPEERDAIVAASPVPAYRTFADAAAAVAAIKRFARSR
jgi:acyl-CoA synthetase (NDP forming)